MKMRAHSVDRLIGGYCDSYFLLLLCARHAWHSAADRLTCIFVIKRHAEFKFRFTSLRRLAPVNRSHATFHNFHSNNTQITQSATVRALCSLHLVVSLLCAMGIRIRHLVGVQLTQLWSKTKPGLCIRGTCLCITNADSPFSRSSFRSGIVSCAPFRASERWMKSLRVDQKHSKSKLKGRNTQTIIDAKSLSPCLSISRHFSSHSNAN